MSVLRADLEPDWLVAHVKEAGGRYILGEEEIASYRGRGPGREEDLGEH